MTPGIPNIAADRLEYGGSGNIGNSGRHISFNHPLAVSVKICYNITESSGRIMEGKSMTTEYIWPGGDLTNAFALRREVFTQEQGFAEPDSDKWDEQAFHVILWEDRQPIATGRVYFEGSHVDIAHVGRVCIKKAFRGRGLGRILLERLEYAARTEGANKAILGAQVQAVPFYEKVGYRVYGKEYMDEHCPHRWMEKKL